MRQSARAALEAYYREAGCWAELAALRIISSDIDVMRCGTASRVDPTGESE